MDNDYTAIKLGYLALLHTIVNDIQPQKAIQALREVLNSQPGYGFKRGRLYGWHKGIKKGRGHAE
jgi:hypothetical protein